MDLLVGDTIYCQLVCAIVLAELVATQAAFMSDIIKRMGVVPSALLVILKSMGSRHEFPSGCKSATAVD